GLTIRAMGAYDSYYNLSSARYKHFPSYTVMKDPNDPDNLVIYQNAEEGPYFSVSKSVNEGQGHKWRKMYGEAGIEYKRLFGGMHQVSALALANLQKAYYSNWKYNLPTAYLGLVGRVTYDYKEKYMAEFNVGYNGSENFPPDKRF